MKEILSEYGKTMIGVIMIALLLGALFRWNYLGVHSGMLGAIGKETKELVEGYTAQEKALQLDQLSSVSEANDECAISLGEAKLYAGEQIGLSQMFEVEKDKEVYISQIWDKNGDGVMNQSVFVDMQKQVICFLNPGIYRIMVRTKERPYTKKTFEICVI